MSTSPVSLPAPWGEHVLPDDEVESVDLGPMRLNLRLRNDEIWIATTSSEPVEPETAEGEWDWMRWPVSGGTRSVRLSPMFPDREIPFPHRTLYTGAVTEPFPIRITNHPSRG